MNPCKNSVIQHNILNKSKIYIYIEKRAAKIKAPAASLLFAAPTASEAHAVKVGVSSPPQDTVS